MSMFTIKHVHEGSVKVEVEHKYSGDREAVSNKEFPQTDTSTPVSGKSISKKDINLLVAGTVLGAGCSVPLNYVTRRLDELFESPFCALIASLLVFFVFLFFFHKIIKKIEL